MNRIKDFREKRGMTQADLASAVGLNPAAISLYESQSRTPNQKRMRAMANALGVGLDKLFPRDAE